MSCDKEEEITHEMYGESYKFVKLLQLQLTWPIRSQKPRQIIMNICVSKTVWRWSIVFIRRSFKGCILFLISDSSTVSFDSWIIFFNFVSFCILVCVTEKRHVRNWFPKLNDNNKVYTKRKKRKVMGSTIKDEYWALTVNVHVWSAFIIERYLHDAS